MQTSQKQKRKKKKFWEKNVYFYDFYSSVSKVKEHANLATWSTHVKQRKQTEIVKIGPRPIQNAPTRTAPELKLKIVSTTLILSPSEASLLLCSWSLDRFLLLLNWFGSWFRVWTQCMRDELVLTRINWLLLGKLEQECGATNQRSGFSLIFLCAQDLHQVLFNCASFNCNIRIFGRHQRWNKFLVRQSVLNERL